MPCRVIWSRSENPDVLLNCRCGHVNAPPEEHNGRNVSIGNDKREARAAVLRPVDSQKDSFGSARARCDIFARQEGVLDNCSSLLSAVTGIAGRGGKTDITWDN